MKTISSLFFALALGLTVSVRADDPYDLSCGNDSQNNHPCNNTGENVGANPINPTKTNHHREVTDITTFGAAPISFGRNVNSRTSDFNDSYWQLGYKQVWQHNWNFETRQLSSKTFGFFDIKVRYPDGNDYNFTATDSTGAQLAPAADNGDRLYRWTGSLVGYTLVTSNGTEYDFYRYLSPAFHLTEMRNGLGYFWDCTYDENEQLSKITNNFGRWIQIDHESQTDGVPRITEVSTSDGRVVTYGYSAWADSGQYVLTTVNYPGGEQAVYTYVTSDPTDPAARPLLASAFDPMYGAGDPGARMKYVYNYENSFDYGGGLTLVTGSLLEERSAVTDQTIVSFPLGSGAYPKVQEGDGTLLTRKYANGLINVTGDGEGRMMTFDRDSGGFGFISARTDARGAVTQFTRDYAGRILIETDPLGYSRTHTYNDKGFPLIETDERGDITTITRDTVNSRPLRKDYADGSYEEWTYDANSQALTHRRRNAQTDKFTYDPLGDMLTRTDALGGVTHYAWYPNGLLLSVTDARNNTTSYIYDWRGNILTQGNPDGTSRTFGYDIFSNRTLVTDELGHPVTYTYDEYNRLQTVTDALNRTTTYEYGLAPGCSACSYVNTVSEITSSAGNVVTYTYDHSRLRTSQTVGAGTTDAATTTYGYDDAKNLTTVTDPRGKIWQSQFDDRHQKLNSTDPLGNETQWTYDEAGNKATETRPDGGVTGFAYDNRNRLITTTDPLNQITQMAYDGSDNLLTLTDARGNIYTYGYDALNRKTSLLYPGGSTELFDYDEVGNLTTHTTRAGQVRTSTYDTRNRETGFTWSDSTPAVTKTYDDASRLLTLTNSASALTFTYDDANQLLSETQEVTGGGGARTVSYSYTLDGKRQTLGYPGGTSLSYGYTARDQISTITGGGVSAGYTYDLNGNRASISFGNGTTAAYTYDDASRLTGLDHQKGQYDLVLLNYGYNNVNNRTSRTETAGTPAQTDAYAYDGIDEVTGVKYNYKAGTDTQDRLVSYDYDATGNRETVGDNGTTTNYIANALNQYTAAGSLTPSYGTNGNLTGQGGWAYTYDAQNRLTSAHKGNGTLAFAYDGRNRCVSRSLNGASSYFTYDGWSLIEERDPSATLVASYIDGPEIDDLVALTEAAGTAYYHQDALGSVVALSAATTGKVVERYTYDIYGAPTVKGPGGQARANSSYGNRFLFTGREYISQISLYDYRNRFYSTAFGRFLQTDPTGFSSGDVNLYRYVFNSPSNKTDPTGLDSADDDAKCLEACLEYCGGNETCTCNCVEKCSNGEWPNPLGPLSDPTAVPPVPPTPPNWLDALLTWIHDKITG